MVQSTLVPNKLRFISKWLSWPRVGDSSGKQNPDL